MVQLDAAYPLSPLQQGMLYHGLSAPRSGVDIEQMVWGLPERIDPARLRHAWEQVVARHAALRTAFRWQGVPEPRQEVQRGVALPWTELDWRHLGAADQAARLAAFLADDRAHGFALDHAPLLRVALIQFSDTHWKLVWTFHHAILDGRSFPLIVQEVFAFYDAAQHGETLPLPAPVPFRQHIEWLRERQQRDQASAESFWRSTLRGFLAPTPLTVDHLQPAARSGGATPLKHTLSPETTAELRRFATDCGTTLGSLVQAALALLLSRYSGQRDIVVGVTRACRRSAPPGSEDAVGLFINTLPLRLDVDPERPLAEWLRETRARWDALRPFEHTPLSQVHAWSEVGASQPLFETLVVFENYQLEEKLRAAGGAWRDRSFDLIERTNFPLTLAGYGGHELALTLQFDPARIDEATAARLLGHVATLLAAMPVSAARRVRELPLVTAEERDALLVRSGAREAHFPPGATLVDWFESQVATTPDRIAVVHEDETGRRELSYREINARANRLAHRLIARGVGPEKKVGLFLDRSVDLVVGVFGILKAGGAYVPMDTSSPRERLAFMIEDAALAVVVTESRVTEKLPALSGSLLLPLDAAPEADTDVPATNPAVALTPENLAYVIYTSGSTGKPKGALVTHHNVVRLFRGSERLYQFGADDVWTLFHSIAFDFSVWELFGALLYGGRLVVVPWLVSRAPELFHALLAREHVTVLNQTPSAFRQLIHADAAAPRDALALRYVIFGGEALELAHLAPWFARHGDQRPQLVNMYGITETTVHVTHRVIRSSDIAAGSVIGAPLPDLQLYLLDESLQPVPIGVPGELFVGGDGLARGYHARAELTAERFIENPFAPGTRLYRTGDRARWLPNHDIEYLGRLDQQVKIRGHRIELGEIESVLARHPAVRDAVVLAREDHGERRLVAYYVPANAAAATEASADLRAFLRPHLPDYMVPADFMRLDRLPLTENGKLDRRALPAPSPSRPEMAVPYVAPRTPLELALAQTWRTVLQIERVGVNDNFFELGGNSLRLVQLLGPVRQAVGRELQIAELFQFPTIRALAAHVQPAAPASSRLAQAQQRAARQAEALRRRPEKMETVS